MGVFDSLLEDTPTRPAIKAITASDKEVVTTCVTKTTNSAHQFVQFEVLKEQITLILPSVICEQC